MKTNKTDKVKELDCNERIAKEPKHYPQPEYCLCNAGHQLVEVFNERRNCYDWDCPICIARMQNAREDATRNQVLLEVAQAESDKRHFEYNQEEEKFDNGLSFYDFAEQDGTLIYYQIDNDGNSVRAEDY
jgi:hypothetical protein